MKISILSDFHFGYGWNSQLENDSFENAQEAIEKSLDSDLILLAGDIFDSITPGTEVWAKSLKILSKPSLSNNSGIKVKDTINKTLEKISKRTLNGIPIIALHGTHERRGKDQINAVQALEQTGFLIHLHCNGLVLEKNNEKIAIQGMSGVPERYAKDILEKWDPKPIKDCYNILMFHQSVEPYVYSPLDPPTLNLSNLPEGFDLIINGHIHTNDFKKIDITNFVIPGSTIITQLKKEESEKPKGFYKLTLPDKFEFVELEKDRKFYYKEIFSKKQKTISEQIRNQLDKILNAKFEKKPLIKFKITGEKSEIIEKDLGQIQKKYENTILKFQKIIESKDLSEKIEFLKKMREEKMSLEEMGMKLLDENLGHLNFKKQFNSNDLFKLLSDGQVERAFNIITKKQTTLKQISGVKNDNPS